MSISLSPGVRLCVVERARIELRVQQRRAGNEAGHAGQRLAPRKRLFPLTFDLSHRMLHGPAEPDTDTVAYQLFVVAFVGIGP